MCQYGQGIVRRLFEEFDVDKLKGFAVWLPMMRNDSLERARAEAALFERLQVALSGTRSVSSVTCSRRP